MNNEQSTINNGQLTMNNANQVPLMFQAQTKGRSQLQYAQTQDAQRWASQWIERAYPQPYQWSETVQTQTYKLSWRFVTNGGQDDGIIRPVIGAFGLPYYPGSSMKGAFRNACTTAQVQRYCGEKLPGGDVKPGILRFHGGYPTDNRWQENLVDLVHPQQDWQVKTNDTRSKKGGAFSLISLYQPEFTFGISSSQDLEEREWETIWQIWEKAISKGLGCRVSAGYGQPQQQTGQILFKAHLQGQGIAPTLLDDTPEFRPNIFRAGVRGHALRIFGGLTDGETADRLVETLFGGVTGSGTVGLLAMNWIDFHPPQLDSFEEGHGEPTYKVDGELRWRLTRKLPLQEEKSLQKLVRGLNRFSMLLGGFGKSWRRVDHRLFYPDYYDGAKAKPLIGCHWRWGENSLERANLAWNLKIVSQLIDFVRKSAREWMELQGITPNPSKYSDWREAWHPENVQVWGRVANSADESDGVEWFHREYRREDRQIGIPKGSIYRTHITGQINQISLLWHRMYPQYKLYKDPKNPKKFIVRPTPAFLELLTIFDDGSQEMEQFLQFLSQRSDFELVWGS